MRRVAAGCGDSGSGGKPVVVATTTQLADFARNVGGDEVDVRQILGPNADPHEYEPRPSDAAAVAEADVVLRSGGDVDEWLDGVIDNAGGDADVVTLIDSVKTPAGERGRPTRTGGRTRATPRSAVTPSSSGRWRRPSRARRPRSPATRPPTRGACARSTPQRPRCIDRLPPAQRKLVTTHDALGYYADRYGLEVIGAVIPSLSTEAQPNAKDTQQAGRADPARRGRRRSSPRARSTPSSKQAIARETGAEVGEPLYADTLGPKGSAGATYVGLDRGEHRAGSSTG